MIPGNRIFTFYVLFCDRKHILNQKGAFSVIIQFHYMYNISRLSCLFLIVHNLFVLVNSA